MLEARNLTFGYGAAPVLKNINLRVTPGEITVLIGPSGTGKTTLLRCLSLLEPAQTGSVVVDDVVFTYPETGKVLPPPPWPKLTAVFQQLFLWPHMTLRENILLPARRRSDGNITSDLEALIDAFDLRDFIDQYPNEASLGQRQRVALARALMLKPRYLLLDEITSALDVEQIAKILSYLKKLRGTDMGIFIITHLLGFARQAADQVIFMANGEIVEAGPPAILTSPQSARLIQFMSVIEAAS